MSTVHVPLHGSVEVIDNLLSDEELKSLENYLLHPDFPWYFNHGVLTPEYSKDNHLDFQFVHTFYDKYAPSSAHIGALDSLLTAIKPNALIRIKANLNPIAPEQVEHGYHVDFDFTCKTAVFYVNTNNGYTKFKTGEVINSVANRLLVFDSFMPHTGSTTTDSFGRVLINLNYFK